MRYILVLLVAIFLFPSCKKKSQNPTVTPVVNNNITSVRKRLEYRPVRNNITYPYVTWQFTGSSPLIAMPDIDTSYFGHLVTLLTGTNATSIRNYNYSPTNLIMGRAVDIFYNPANLPEKILFNTSLSGTTIEFFKISIEYAENHITNATLYHANDRKDTLNWVATDKYHYYYDGNNVSRIGYSAFRSPGWDSSTYAYFAGSKSNNLADIPSTGWMLEFLARTDAPESILLHIPLYSHANILDSISTTYHQSRYTTQFITTTDTFGRIVQQIANYGPTNKPDTVFYTY